MSNSDLWAPGLIGYAVSGLMYGATLGQSICYTLWFPNDPWLTRAFVFMVFLADTGHLIGGVHFVWTVLVSCRQNYSWSCTYKLPWGGHVLLWCSYMISTAVQSFYCRRIWTISGKNKPLTLAIFVLAFSGFVFGTWFSIVAAQIGTIEYMLASPLILPCAGASTLCDFLITFAVFKYMWKSGFRRQRSVIQDLAVVCINTGAFTCAVAAITGIVYLIQGDKYWVFAVGIVFSRCYVNSMLAVLNARKTIRDRDANVYTLTTISAAL